MNLPKKIFGEEHWEKLRGTRRASKSFRAVLDVVLMLSTDVFIALSLQIDNPRWVFILIAAISLISELVVLSYYLAFDNYIKNKTDDELVNLKKTAEEYEIKYNELSKNIAGYEESLNSVQAIIEVTANNIRAFYHKLIENDGKVKETVWNYRQTCALVCRDVYSILAKLYKCEKDIEVTYVAFDKEENVCHMLAYESMNREIPSIYSHDRVIPKRVKHTSQKYLYCFEKLYLAREHAPLILLDEESIKKNFYFSTQEDRDKCKYKQYIAIPICCQTQDIIGMLQIAIFKHNIIGGDEDAIKQFLNTVLRPIAYLTLLSQKMQRCIDVVSEEQK